MSKRKNWWRCISIGSRLIRGNASAGQAGGLSTKIILDFEAVSAGSELTIVFSQDRNRATGALAKPRVEVIGTVPDAIRNSAQAFAHLPKLD